MNSCVGYGVELETFMYLYFNTEVCFLCRDSALNATYKNEILPNTGNTGLLNFTNPQVPGPGSSACSLNGLTYQDANAMQEIIGELHELSLWNVNVHPYHHHTQP